MGGDDDVHSPHLCDITMSTVHAHRNDSQLLGTSNNMLAPFL